jgi:four helix bundle protein
MRKSAVSIASNIAEGAGRNSDKDFQRFLGIALGSAFELQTQVIICSRLKLIEEEEFIRLNENIEEIKKMIWGFKKSISSNSMGLTS